MKKKRIVIYSVFLLGIIFIYTFFHSSRPYVIGVVGDYLTEESRTSLDAYVAAEMAFEELNRTKQRNYKIVSVDINELAGKDSLIKLIKKNKIDILVGPSSTEQYLMIKNQLSEIKIPVFCFTVSTDEITNVEDNLFRLNDSISSEARSLINVLEGYLKVDEVDVIYCHLNRAYTEALAYEVMSQLSLSDVQVRVECPGEYDMDVVMKQLMSKEYDDVVVVIAGPGRAGIITQLVAANNPEARFLLSQWAESPATDEYLENVTNEVYSLVAPVSKNQEMMNKFIEKLEKNRNTEFSMQAFYAYESVYFLDYVISSIGTVDYDKVQNFVHRLEIYEGKFSVYHFDGTGDGQRGFSVSEFKNNKFNLLPGGIENNRK